MNQNTNDINSYRRMLREIADLAENASLTGGLSSGAPRAVQRYNAVLNHLVESGAVPKGLFEPLNPEAADFGQLGVDARLLASYLKGQEGESGSGGDASVLIRLAPFVRGEDLAMLVKEHMAKGAQISDRVITALAPFLGSDQLGQLIREHMLHASTATGAPQAEPSGATPPQAPTPPNPPQRETLEELAAMLRRPELSREERERIAARIAELASER